MQNYLKYKWLWILLMILLGPFSFLILGFVFNCYDDEKWYMNIWLWIISVLLIFPAIVLFIYLIADLITKITFYLRTPLSQLYKYPFVWVLSFIPVVGLYVFIFLYTYLVLSVSFKLIISREEGDVLE